MNDAPISGSRKREGVSKGGLLGPRLFFLYGIFVLFWKSKIFVLVKSFCFDNICDQLFYKEGNVFPVCLCKNIYTLVDLL